MKITKITKIHNGLYEHICPRCGSILASASDIDLMPEFAKAYAERGRAKNLKGDKEGAFSDLKKSIELNPESDEAKLMNGEHSNFDNLYKGGIY